MIIGDLWGISSYFYILYSIAAFSVNCTKQKRQLFREQVLPDKGGKIPESAFNPERLFFNRLNQQGITVPDGVIVQHRRQEKHPFPKQELPDTLKVSLTDEGRFIAAPGRYQYDKTPTVDTTYVIRLPVVILHKNMKTPQPYKGVQSVQDFTVDIGKWVPPIWYNEIISNSEYKKDEDIDPSQVLAEYSSYLQKIHKYDKK